MLQVKKVDKFVAIFIDIKTPELGAHFKIDSESKLNRISQTVFEQNQYYELERPPMLQLPE